MTLLSQIPDGASGADVRQTLNASLSAGLPMPSPQWAGQPGDGDKGPQVGGRVHQRLRRPRNTRTLAHLATVADSYFTSSAIGLADVAADDALVGTTQNVMTLTGTAGGGVSPVAPNAVPTDVRGGLIRVWFRPVHQMKSGLTSFRILLHSSGSAQNPPSDLHQMDMTSTMKQVVTNDGGGTWQSVTFPATMMTATGAGADLSAIRWAKVAIAGATGMQLALGNVEFVPNGLAKAKCIIGFDDAYLSAMRYGAPMLAKYGFPAVLYPSPVAAVVGTDPTRLTANQIKSLHDYMGWQIASQAWSSESEAAIVTDMTHDRRTAEMAKLRNWHNALGLTGGDHGSYFSNVGPGYLTAYPMFRQHFRTMRAYFLGNGGQNLAPFDVPETYPWSDPMRIRALGYEFNIPASDSFAQHLKLHVDQAIAHKGVAFLVWHDGLNTAGYRQVFADMLAYLDANRAAIDVVTEEDLHFGG